LAKVLILVLSIGLLFTSIVNNPVYTNRPSNKFFSANRDFLGGLVTIFARG